MSVELLWSGPETGPVLVLAHGAGSGMETPWLTAVTASLGDRGIRTVRFEFGYMAARRDGVRRATPRAEAVLDEYREVVARVSDAVGGPVAIGGKSFGGRVASMIADDEHDAGRVSALVCLGYPFHPPGAPEKLRTAHLEHLRTPALIVQGTRDPFGTLHDVARYPLSPSIRIRWLEDGDHEFRPRAKLTGLTQRDHLATATDAVADFLRQTSLAE